MEALDFLDSIQGPPRGSADRPAKFAVIDPAYDPTTYPATLPRVTFDGETTMTVRRFAVIGSYWPYPGERVFMEPGGTGYVIMGALPSSVTMPGRDRITATITDIGAEQVVLSVPFTFKGGWAYEVKVRGQVYGTAGLQGHFRLRKTSAAGADWGEYGRVPCSGNLPGQANMVNGSIFLLRTASTSLTATVTLTCARNSGAASDTVNFLATLASPAYMMIVPIGPAVMFAGFGVDVT